MHSYTQEQFRLNKLHLSSSRLQPEKYRRLLGSTGCGRTSRSSFDTSSGLGTIDREPSPAQHQLPDNGDCDGGETGDPGEGGREVRGEEGSSGTTLRNRWRGRGAGGGGRETSESCLAQYYY